MLLRKIGYILCCTLALGACDIDEPMIEGKSDVTLDYKAQRREFRVVQPNGKPYNYKVDWYIRGLYYEDTHHRYQPLTSRVDTLASGALRIATDWISFTTAERKSKIIVEVLENNSGKKRKVFFRTGAGKGRFLPDLFITQKPRE